MEKVQLRQIAESAADAGPVWPESYAPGSFGCHELLDRTAMLADLVECRIQRHPACVANPEWYFKAEQAVATLRDLYQQIGAEHLTAEVPARSLDGTAAPGEGRKP